MDQLANNLYEWHKYIILDVTTIQMFCERLPEKKYFQLIIMSATRRFIKKKINRQTKQVEWSAA